MDLYGDFVVFENLDEEKRKTRESLEKTQVLKDCVWRLTFQTCDWMILDRQTFCSKHVPSGNSCLQLMQKDAGQSS